MLDYKVHFGLLVDDDQLRSVRQRAEQKRVFRLGAPRRSGRR